MKSLRICILCIVFMLSFNGFSQEVIVTDDASYTSPQAGAILDVKSTTKGVIIPRLTTAERTTLGNTHPATGVMVFDSEVKAFYYWDGDWKQLAATGLNLTGYKFGNATDYATFENDGTLALYGKATVWDDIMVPTYALRSNVNPPTFRAFVSNLWLYYFDDAGANSENQVYFAVQFPHSWASDTIYPHVHWTPSDNTGGAVTWAFEYSWAEYNSTTPEVFPSTTTITVNAPVAVNSQNKHLIGSLPYIIPTESQNGISSMMVCRLYRNSSNNDDTYTGNAGLLQFDIHFKKNTEGSRLQFIK